MYSTYYALPSILPPYLHRLYYRNIYVNNIASNFLAKSLNLKYTRYALATAATCSVVPVR